MRRLSTPVTSLFAVAAVLGLCPPARALALTVFRAPLLLVRGATEVAVHLPELPTFEQDHAALRRQLAEQQLELTRLREAVRRAGRLQELARLLTPETLSVVTVIGRTVVPNEHLVLIDRGERHGIVKDAVLLDARGLVGRVLETHPTTSLAMLVTDPDSRIACLIERTRELGLLVGTGGTLCRLDHLDLEANVVAGDLVVTAGLDGPFPKGLVVGTVVTVIKDETDASARAIVRPVVNLRQVEEMLCLPPAASSS